jgi:Gamma-glutamyltranspeptidase
MSSSSARHKQVRKLGIRGAALPPFHAVTVTVPGAAAAWEDAVQQWGTLPLSQARASVQICYDAALWAIFRTVGRQQQWPAHHAPPQQDT